MSTAVADIFATAAPVAPKEPTKGKAKKVEVKIASTVVKDEAGAVLKTTNPLDLLAAADALAKTLKTVADVHSTEVKSLMTKHFAHEGTMLGRRPENFRGLGDKSSASCQLKQRDERRVLAPEEVEILTAAGVAMDEKVTQEEAYQFNQEVLANPELRAKISAAFALIDFGGLNPLVKLEKVTSKVVNEQSLETVYSAAKAKADTAKTPAEKEAAEKEAAKLAGIVGTLAITPKFEGTLKDAMTVLMDAGITL